MIKLSPSAILPRILPPVLRKQATIAVSKELIEAATRDTSDILTTLKTSTNGLPETEVEERIEQYGRNIVVKESKHTWVNLLWTAIRNPLVVLLAVVGTVAYLTHDIDTAVIILIMILLGIVLRFVQEYRADNASAKLRAMIHVTATVIRDGAPQEIPLSNVVPGDIVKLAAGDMIPADVRLISSKDLFIVQSALTGESLPVEKFDTVTRPTVQSPFELETICFLGTSVQSGTGTAVVMATGFNTYLGGMASAITEQAPQTNFDKGIKRFTWLMIRYMLVMVPLVFVISGLTKGNWTEAFFFALAIAVGLTPEMLPMIVTVCLSKGAISMSRKKVIIKRLHSIQNFGAMDVLCTDKTGTLTLDKVILEQHCDVAREQNDEVMVLAYLNSYFQTGLKNVLDRAIIQHTEILESADLPHCKKVDEIPFDFARKVMSVIVEMPDSTFKMITKGATEEIFSRCTHFELDGDIDPIEPILLEDLKEVFRQLSADGFRVLAIAYKNLDKKPAYAKSDECDMILKGYLAFLDPPKDTAAPAISAIQAHGISMKVLTGDNELVTKKICHEVGLPVDHVVLGSEVESLSDADLAEVAEKSTVFARLSPSHKQRIVNALRSKGHTVGFMGDGINDAPALRVADVGISVDTAVDIAKESADVILLEKSLMVLEEGVLEGRKVFANILKYVRMGASSNFGNMFSVLGACIFLPYLPMLPVQILTNNLLYDFSQTAIPTDDVDPEQIAKPRPWSMGEISRFIMLIGPISSIFDYATFFIMLYIFKAWDPSMSKLFQTGWFVESLVTQTIIIHVIRTNKIPFLQSRASVLLMMTSAIIIFVGVLLPYSPFAGALSFTALPVLYWPLLFVMVICYITLTQVMKNKMLKLGWI